MLCDNVLIDIVVIFLICPLHDSKSCCHEQTLVLSVKFKSVITRI